jgi:hypothetical protein
MARLSLLNCGPALLALSLVADNLRAEVNRWESFGPPVSVTALEIDRSNASTLYAAAADGIYRSADHGSTWSLINAELREIYCLTSAAGGEPTLYAGGLGIFRSTDAGATWSQLGGNLPVGPVIRLLIDPNRPNVLYAVVHNWGLFKSADGGSTWSQVGYGVVSDVQSLAADPRADGSIWAGDILGRVFRIDGRGAALSSGAGLPGHPVTSLSIDPTEPQKMYAATYHGGIFKTTDSGATWVPASNGLATWTVNAVAVDSHDPTVVYAATQEPPSVCCVEQPPSGGVYRSTDGGTTWSTFNTGLAPRTGIRHVDVDPTGTYVFALPIGGIGTLRYQVAGPQISISPALATNTTWYSSEFQIHVAPPLSEGAWITYGSSDPEIAWFLGYSQVFLTPLQEQISLTAYNFHGGRTTITVELPQNLGGAKASAELFVSNPVPEIAAMTPTERQAGSEQFTLYVYQPGRSQTFAPDSVVRWNGSPRPTRLNGLCNVGCYRWLEATITSDDVANPGTATIAVITPGPGGGTSNAVSLQIIARRAPVVRSPVRRPNPITAPGRR